MQERAAETQAQNDALSRSGDGSSSTSRIYMLSLLSQKQQVHCLLLFVCICFDLRLLLDNADYIQKERKHKVYALRPLRVFAGMGFAAVGAVTTFIDLF